VGLTEEPKPSTRPRFAHRAPAASPRRPPTARRGLSATLREERRGTATLIQRRYE